MGEPARQAGREPVTIDTPLRFESPHLRRFSGLSARRLAARAPGATKWCAENMPSETGRACTEAIARRLGLWPAGGGSS